MGGYVGKEEKVERYLHNNTQPMHSDQHPLEMYLYENIWNRIGKGKYKLSYVLWVGMWVRKK